MSRGIICLRGPATRYPAFLVCRRYARDKHHNSGKYSPGAQEILAVMYKLIEVASGDGLWGKEELCGSKLSGLGCQCFGDGGEMGGLKRSSTSWWAVVAGACA